jgi:hypothetical protein
VASYEGGHDVFMVAGREAGPPATAGTGRREALHWLAGLQPTGGPPFPEVLEEMSGGRAGPGSYLLVAPTWRHNRAPALAPSVASLATSGARVMAAMVDAQPFRPRAPVLGPAELEELERTLQSEGADVCRIEAPVDVERLGLRRR